MLTVLPAEELQWPVHQALELVQVDPAEVSRDTNGKTQFAGESRSSAHVAVPFLTFTPDAHMLLGEMLEQPAATSATNDGQAD